MELFPATAGYTDIMTRAFLRILKPVALASALLLSAPVFVIVDQTFYGKNTIVAVSKESFQSNKANITIIFKT